MFLNFKILKSEAGIIKAAPRESRKRWQQWAHLDTARRWCRLAIGGSRIGNPQRAARAKGTICRLQTGDTADYKICATTSASSSNDGWNDGLIRRPSQ
jgi:hypothetical protein